jgi:putative spermidine/putrescine transport system substrate-binding protein
MAFPNVITSPKKLKLRVLGTHVTLQEEIRKKAENDLNLDISFKPGGSASVLHQAATDPNSFDIYEQWSNSIRVLWQANAIQGINIEQIQNWNEVNALTKKGRVVKNAPLGLGDAPYRILHQQPNGSLGPQESSLISFLPYVHNADSYGYNSAIIPKGIPYETESWGWLLDENNRGKTAIVNAPTIGLFDLALAVSAKGLMNFKDMGNMSRSELDQLFEIIMEYKSRGHFRGVWSSVPHSVDLMAKGEVNVQSMFSPGVSTLNGMGIPCIYAAPKEGYRAWHGVMCLSSAANSDQKEAAYRFMNWWLSGWPGAFIARQGYYISNPQRSKTFMSQDEWDYWYEGQEARQDLKGTDGKISVKKGEIRSGGSYIQRMGNVAVWNTVMPQYEYSLIKWNEFLLG